MASAVYPDSPGVFRCYFLSFTWCLDAGFLRVAWKITQFAARQGRIAEELLKGIGRMGGGGLGFQTFHSLVVGPTFAPQPRLCFMSSKKHSDVAGGLPSNLPY